MPRAVAWVGTLVGLAGIVAAVGLIRRLSWARAAVIVIGLINVAGGVVARVQHWSGGVVGVVLGLAAVGLALMPARTARSSSTVLAR
jgi:hypothetical protein